MCVRSSKEDTEHYVPFECEMTTTIGDIKEKVAGWCRDNATGEMPTSRQTLTFMNQVCEDHRQLADYGICQPWINQVRWVWRLTCFLSVKARV